MNPTLKAEKEKKYEWPFGILDIKYMHHVFYADMLLHWLHKMGSFLWFFYGSAIDYAMQVAYKRIMEETRPD